METAIVFVPPANSAEHLDVSGKCSAIHIGSHCDWRQNRLRLQHSDNDDDCTCLAHFHISYLFGEKTTSAEYSNQRTWVGVARVLVFGIHFWEPCFCLLVQWQLVVARRERVSSALLFVSFLVSEYLQFSLNSPAKVSCFSANQRRQNSGCGLLDSVWLAFCSYLVLLHLEFPRTTGDQGMGRTTKRSVFHVWTLGKCFKEFAVYSFQQHSFVTHRHYSALKITDSRHGATSRRRQHCCGLTCGQKRVFSCNCAWHSVWCFWSLEEWWTCSPPSTTNISVRYQSFSVFFSSQICSFLAGGLTENCLNANLFVVDSLTISKETLDDVVTVNRADGTATVGKLQFRWDFILVYIVLRFLQGGGVGEELPFSEWQLIVNFLQPSRTEARHILPENGGFDSSFSVSKNRIHVCFEQFAQPHVDQSSAIHILGNWYQAVRTFTWVCNNRFHNTGQPNSQK